MLTPDRTVHTTCPYCGVGCQIDLQIKNEMIYRVDGRFDNDVNNGKLCVKGRFGYDFIHAPDRLTRPLLKVSGDSAPGVSSSHQPARPATAPRPPTRSRPAGTTSSARSASSARG